jgi:hypothetical protein
VSGGVSWRKIAGDITTHGLLLHEAVNGYRMSATAQVGSFVKILHVIQSVTWKCIACGRVTVMEDKGQSVHACKCGTYCRKVTEVADEVVL